MSRRSVALLFTLSALWGASYLFIKVALEDVFSAWSIVSIRTALAALVLVPLAAKLGALNGIRGRLGPIVVLSFVQVSIPLTLIGLGEEHIASSLTGILVASAPIFTFLLAFALEGEERASGLSLAGVVIRRAHRCSGTPPQTLASRRPIRRRGCLSRRTPARSMSPARRRTRTRSSR